MSFQISSFQNLILFSNVLVLLTETWLTDRLKQHLRICWHQTPVALRNFEVCFNSNSLTRSQDNQTAGWTLRLAADWRHSSTSHTCVMPLYTSLRSVRRWVKTVIKKTVEFKRKQLALRYLFFGRFFFVNVFNCHLPMNKNTASMTAHQCTVIGTNYFLKS